MEVDEDTLAASVPGIYAGGDLIRGSDTVVRAVGDGKKAAYAMDAWIQSH
jgi:glutamate synthase (NADPH/NADH) small chain